MMLEIVAKMLENAGWHTAWCELSNGETLYAFTYEDGRKLISAGHIIVKGEGDEESMTFYGYKNQKSADLFYVLRQFKVKFDSAIYLRGKPPTSYIFPEVIEKLFKTVSLISRAVFFFPGFLFAFICSFSKGLYALYFDEE